MADNNTVEYSRLFNDYILSDIKQSITIDNTGTIKSNTETIEVNNEETVSYDNEPQNSLSFVRTAGLSKTFAYYSDNRGVYQQFIYEYSIVRHPDINFKTVAIQISNCSNLAKIIYDKAILDKIFTDSNSIDSSYMVDKNGWLMALANPNKWFDALLQQYDKNNSFSKYKSVNNLPIESSSNNNYRFLATIYKDKSGNETNFVEVSTNNKLDEKTTYYYYNKENKNYVSLAWKFQNDSNGNVAQSFLISNEKIYYVYSSSNYTETLTYNKPTYHIIGVGPLIEKQNDELEVENFDNYWCNNKLVLYMYVLDTYITELKNIINRVPDLELIELYSDNNDTVDTLDGFANMTMQINNHHETVDNKQFEFNEVGYKSIGTTINNLNVITKKDNEAKPDFTKVVNETDSIETYAPKSSRYINNYSIIYNKPYGTHDGNKIFGPETIYRFNYDSFKLLKDAIIDRKIISDTPFITVNKNASAQQLVNIPAIPRKTFTHKFNTIAKSELPTAELSTITSTSQEHQVYLLSRLNFSDIKNIKFTEGHHKLYLDVSMFDELINVVHTITEIPLDMLLLNLMPNNNFTSRYIPIEVLPLYDWTEETYYWELNCAGNTILTFNESERINLNGLVLENTPIVNKPVYKLDGSTYSEATIEDIIDTINDALSSGDSGTVLLYPNSIVNSKENALTYEVSRNSKGEIDTYTLFDNTGNIIFKLKLSVTLNGNSLNNNYIKLLLEQYNNSEISITNTAELFLMCLHTDATIFNYSLPLKCTLTEKTLELGYGYNYDEYVYSNKKPYVIYKNFDGNYNNLKLEGLTSLAITNRWRTTPTSQLSPNVPSYPMKNQAPREPANMPNSTTYNEATTKLLNKFKTNGIITNIDYGTNTTKYKYTMYFKLTV